MSDIIELLGQQLGGDALKELSGAIGADEAATEKGLAAVLPMLLGGLAKNADNDQGAEQLHAAIERDHDGGLLDNLGDLLRGQQQPVMEQERRHPETHSRWKTGSRCSGSESFERPVERCDGPADEVTRSGTDGCRRQAATATRIELRWPRQMARTGARTIRAKGTAKRRSAQCLLDTDGDGDLDMSDLLAHGSRFLSKKS